MRSSTTAAIGLLVFACLACACTATTRPIGRTVMYGEPFKVGGRRFHETTSRLEYSMGEVVDSLTKCLDDEKFICVRSDLPHSFPFAIARDSAIREWDFEGNHYRVWDDPSDPMPDETRMIVVDVKDSDNRFWFLYSYDLGVLAYSWQLTSRDSRPWWVVLKGKKGILASPRNSSR